MAIHSLPSATGNTCDSTSSGLFDVGKVIITPAKLCYVTRNAGFMPCCSILLDTMCLLYPLLAICEWPYLAGAYVTSSRPQR